VADASWVLLAGVHHQCMDVFIFTPTELAGEIAGNGCTILAHVTTSQISTSQLPNFRPPTRRMVLSFCNMDYSITFTPYSEKCLSAVTTVKPFKSAVAMMKRSAGSLWCSGSKDALNMIVVSRGAMSSA